MNTPDVVTTWTEQLLDVGGLAPPEPLVLILEALDRLDPCERLRVLIDREPHPLYSILERNGYHYRCSALADAQYQLMIWAGTPPGQCA